MRTSAVERYANAGTSAAVEFWGRVRNLVVLPYRGEAVWWCEKDRFEQKYFGNHGGLTPREMEIPLLAWAA